MRGYTQFQCRADSTISSARIQIIHLLAANHHAPAGDPGAGEGEIGCDTRRVGRLEAHLPPDAARRVHDAGRVPAAAHTARVLLAPAAGGVA